MSKHYRFGFWSGFWFGIGAFLGLIATIIEIVRTPLNYPFYILVLSSLAYLTASALMMLQGDVDKMIDHSHSKGTKLVTNVA